ncbi:MAG: RNA polymerase sigma-70 factor [Sediminibacterium sp.]|nr:RNA polymerase sigma-70 factor [Sediminibacterium sp.]
MVRTSSYQNTTSNTLFRQVSEGNETAFRLVFEQYKAPFYTAAFKMIRSAELAEDIVQEVFISFWKKRELVALAENPEAYLFKMLHNVIYTQFRKLAQERELKQTLSDVDAALEEDSVEALLLEKENRILFETVIGQLPAQQQMVYRLAKQEGLSREEIAEKLHISPNTVRNHLAAAVTFIRDYFNKEASALIWMAIWSSL